MFTWCLRDVCLMSQWQFKSMMFACAHDLCAVWAMFEKCLSDDVCECLSDVWCDIWETFECSLRHINFAWCLRQVQSAGVVFERYLRDVYHSVTFERFCVWAMFEYCLSESQILKYHSYSHHSYITQSSLKHHPGQKHHSNIPKHPQLLKHRSNRLTINRTSNNAQTTLKEHSIITQTSHTSLKHHSNILNHASLKHHSNIIQNSLKHHSNTLNHASVK